MAVSLLLTGLLSAWPVSARILSIDSAPLIINRRDIAVTINSDGTWALNGTMEIKVNSEQGRSLISAFRFPVADYLEEVKITKADIYDANGTKTINLPQIGLRDIDARQAESPALFLAKKSYLIPFGDAIVGSIASISYEIRSTRPRIPSHFSMAMTWGQEYPEMAGTATFESKEPLYFDVSAAAKNHFTISQGKTPDGRGRWQLSIKSPIYKKYDREGGGILTSAQIPRVQVSNQNSWQSVVDFIKKKFDDAQNEPLPAELQQIVEKAKSASDIDEKINRVLESLNNLISFNKEWSTVNGDLSPAPLKQTVEKRRGDAKDFAFATVSILKALGLKANPTLSFRQSPTDRLWIEERPTTPSLALFNHVIVRVIDGKTIRYFDPSAQVAFGEGFMGDLAGSWVLNIATDSPIFDRLPAESPMPSKIKIVQSFDLRPDASIVAAGTANVEGPLAAELKQLFLLRGATGMEPYLRSLFGLAVKYPSVSPLIRFASQDRRGKKFELSYSYVLPKAINSSGPYRDFELSSPGIAGIPLYATPDRSTDVLLSKNLTIEMESKVRGGEITDETNSSCLVLTSFASLIRETQATKDGFDAFDHIQFRTERIGADQLKAPKFKNEIDAYSNCLARTRVSVGPRPAFEKAQLDLTPGEIVILKKPISQVTLQDIEVLEEIGASQIRSLVQTKIWLAMRDMLKRNIRTPIAMLAYANSLINMGRLDDDTYLNEHIAEATKIFVDIAKPLAKSAKLHRVHANLLMATGRFSEAQVAIKNAITLDPDQTKDAVLMGQIYWRLGDPISAEPWLLKATSSRGSISARVPALESLANLKFEQRKYPDFMGLYERALKESPNNPWVHNNYAKRLQELRMWDKSIERSKSAISLLRFQAAETTLAETLVKKAEEIYFTSPGVATSDPKRLERAEALALESMKFAKSIPNAFRIAGHAAFLRALRGEYGSLIATQSYFAKAIDLGVSDPWIKERYFVANQALTLGRPLPDIWASYQKQMQANQQNLPTGRMPSANPPSKK